MFRTISTILAFLLLGVAAQVCLAQDEKALVISTASALETSPLDPETVHMRERALKWLIETPDVHLTVCGGDTMHTILEKKNKNGPDMLAGYMIGMGAFKLQHPDQADDESAAQLAGLETALKVYEAIVKEKPKTKFDAVDAILVKRDQGGLKALVATFDCSKK